MTRTHIKINGLKKQITRLWSSVSTKVILVMLIVILPFNIFTIILSDLSVKNVTRQARLSVENVMQSYMTDMKARMDNVVSLLYMYIMKKGNADAVTLMKQQEDDAYDMAKYRFYFYFKDIAGISKSTSGAFLYLEKMDDLLIWNMDSTIHSLDQMKAYLSGATGEDMTLGWQMHSISGSGGEEWPVLLFFTRMQNTVSGGWIELESTARTMRGDFLYEDMEIFFSDAPVKDDDSAYMTVSVWFEKADMYLNAKISRQELNGTVFRVYDILRRVSFLALMLIPFLYILLSRLLLSPLKVINSAHKQLRSGNPDFRIGARASSIEYQEAYDSFNTMADALKDLKIQNYEKELEKQKIMLKNLQLQIRPHFLINCFNLIFTLSQEKDVAHIQDVMLYLSDYFRYIFRSNKELELFGREENMIAGYINMAKLRYPDSISYDIDYDPQIALVRLPPLLLHNFVENIVKHVVVLGTMTHIQITGRYRDKTAIFKITDDGPGMDEAQRQQVLLNMRRTELSGESVGMANAYGRLKYFYGENADIEIFSRLGEGTTITVIIPYNLEADDESINCQ